MLNSTSGKEETMKIPRQSAPVLRIPAPVKNVTGLGDVVKAMTGAFGVKACKGCQQRAAVLNRWVGLTPIGGPR